MSRPTLAILAAIPALAFAQPADQPSPRADANSQLAHTQLLAKAKAGGIDIYFEGDSITRRWHGTDYPEFQANWKQNFFGWNAANFGWGGDTTQNILWRLEHGELDGVNPKIIVLLSGTNNVGREVPDDAKIADITRGVRAIVDLCRAKAPAATLILTAIFPRNDNPTVVPGINRINENLARFADGKKIRFLNINAGLADADGRLFDGLTVDKLHLTAKGYQVWADALKPIFTELLGPPAATDHAPAPTGDPSAAGKSTSAAPAPAAPAAAPAAFPGAPSPEERQRMQALTAQDHKNMLEQLGITKLRPGPSGSTAPGTVNPANYDQAKANPFPDLPDVLTLKNGTKVATPEMWWQQRRPEIVEDFEREVIGRVPKNVPKVTWEITRAVTTKVGDLPVVAKQLIGHVDNSACTEITVDIKMAVVTPADAKAPVPVLMMFGFGGMPDDPAPGFGRGPGRTGAPVGPVDPPSTNQLIAAGWGYVSINTTSIQADNGAGLTKGIIGLTNKGQPRKPDDWGSLRAWAWGAARGLDYLETDPAVDAKHVGIEGVSRYGKAALVAMAFEPRFALALVGSSGEGGAKLHRRNFGEAVENLTGSGEYHWMAGNFLKYGADESKFGSKNAGDLPVDAHELIALCAPRFTFISYGIPEKGDANWLDQQGSYMATVAASPVIRLLGARDLGVTEDYHTAKMPPFNTGLLDGELAWRQHDGGHEDHSNMKYFIAWANRLLHHTPPVAGPAPAP